MLIYAVNYHFSLYIKVHLTVFPLPPPFFLPVSQLEVTKTDNLTFSINIPFQLFVMHEVK